MKKTKNMFALGIMVFMMTCTNRATFVDEKFNGYWASTEWIYEFNKDGTFKFIVNGHYDFSEYNGRYIISDSIIFLNPDTDWQVFHGVIKQKLKIIDSECLRDYDNNFYCKNHNIVGELSEKELEFQTKTIDILDTLSIVRQEKKRLSKYEQKTAFGDDLEVKIRYSGIIVVKKQEFHLFQLEQTDLLNTWILLDVMVKKKPFEIYEHISVRDSLKLIYKSKLN